MANCAPPSTHVQTEPQPSAILDLRFHHAQDKQQILAVISSTGTLAIFNVDPAVDAGSPLQHLATSRCDDLGEDVLFLQCQWHPQDHHVLGVTTSSGAVRLLQLDQQWRISGFVDLDIDNSLEAWAIAFAPDSSAESTAVYSGGDDSILRYNSYSRQSQDEDWEPSFGPMSVKGQHDAGVTAIEPLNLENSDGRLVITGSYDDRIRLFSICDLPKSYGMKKVKPLAELNLNGGVWRLDMVDTENRDDGITVLRILASCMYAGARLVQLTGDADGNWEFAVLAKFEEHESMNYACAVVPERSPNGALGCVSTSFYDKKLCLWEYK